MTGARKPPPLRPTRLAFALEPRMMFDGAAVPTALTMVEATKLTPTAADKTTALDPSHAADRLTAAPVATAKPLAETKPATVIAPVETAPAAPAAPTAKQIVFVDPGVAGSSSLIAGLRDSGAEIVMLRADQDGIAQITAALAGRTDLSAIHIVSHGSDGAVTLGNVTLDTKSLDAHLGELAQWRSALRPGADLLLYGCNVAADATGVAFIDRLSAVTGADVAASSDATGGAALGGNWALERATGRIETASAFTDQVERAYDGLLAAPAAGGAVTAANPGGGAASVQADSTTPTILRITPTTLNDPDGGTPSSIRLISAIGGTVTKLDGSAITFGQNGTLIALTAGSADVKFTPYPTASAAQLVYVVVDAQATTNPNSGQSVISVPISTINHAPSLDPTLALRLDASYIDPAANNPGTLLSTLTTRQTDPSVGRLFDADPGTTLGFAVVGSTGTNGTWEYSTNNGASWAAMGTVSDANALLLDASSTRVRFNGMATWNGSASLSVRAWDESAGSASTSASPVYMSAVTNGGSTAFSATTASISATGILVSGASTKPILYASGETTMTPGDTRQAVAPTLIIDNRVTTTLSGATVKIQSGNLNPNQDRLNFTNQSGITGSYNTGTGVLTLTGTASIAAYQTALRSVTYSNALRSPIVIPKAVQIAVTDSTGKASDTNSGFTILGVAKGGAAAVTANDTIQVNGGTSTVITPSTLLANDNAGTLGKIIDVGSATHGTVAYDAALGTITFTPEAGFTGTASFTYRYAPNAFYDPALGVVHSFAALPASGLTMATRLDITGQPVGQTFANNQLVRGANSGAVGVVVDKTLTGSVQTQLFVTMLSGHFWAGEALQPVTGSGTGTVSTVTMGIYDYAVYARSFGMGGYTATATSVQKSNFVYNLYPQVNNGGNAPAAGTDTQQEGVWIWNTPIGTGTSAGIQFWQGGVSGTQYGYAGFGGGEPNGGTNENAVVFSSSSTWWDITTRHNNIREIPIEFGGRLGDSADYPSVTVTVTVRSTSPTAAAPTTSLPAVAKTNVSPSGATVSELFTPVYQDPFYPISNGGIAVTGNAAVAADGVWQYRSGGVWTALPTGLSDTNALVLDSASELRFVPSGTGSATPGGLTVRMWDGTQSSVGTGRNLTGLIGGNNAFAADADRVTLTTTVVNSQSAPVATGGSVSLPDIAKNAADPSSESVGKLFDSVYNDAETPIGNGGVAVTGTTANPITEGTWQYSIDKGASWSNFGLLSQSAAFTLASTDLVRFLPAPGFTGSPPSLTVRLWDRSSGTLHSSVDTTVAAGGSGSFSTGFVSLGAAVIDNTAPVTPGGILTLPSQVRNSGAGAGDTVGNIFTSVYSDAQQPVNSGGVAVIGNASVPSQGTWQYSTDGGTLWLNVPSVTASSAFTLRATDKLRFVPATNFFGPVGGLTVVLWDRTTGAANKLVDTTGTARGGATAFSTGEVTAKLNVDFVNSAPVSSAALVTMPNAAINNASSNSVSALIAGVYSDKDTPITNGGLVITDNASVATQGVWQYSTDNGHSWITLPAVTPTTAFILSSSDLIRFVPVTYFTGTPGSLTAKLWDANTGSAHSTIDATSSGGTTSLSSVSLEVRVTVNSNTAPTPTGPTVTAPNVPQNNTTGIGTLVSSLFSGVWSDPQQGVNGIAILANASVASEGRWQVTSDSTGLSGWFNVPTVSTTSVYTVPYYARIRFIPNGTFTGSPGPLTVMLWDRTALSDFSFRDSTATGARGGVGSLSVGTVSLGLTVGNNAAPVATGGSVSLAPIDGGVTNPNGATVQSLITGVFSDIDQPITSSGVAITGNAATASQGTWQYSNDGGTTWNALPAVSATSAFLLPANDLLRFVPGPYFNGTPGALTAALWDQTDGLAETSLNITGKRGGVKAFSATDVAITTFINDNNAPVATSTTASEPTILEDAAAPAGATVQSLVSGLYTDHEQPVNLGGVVVTANTAAVADGKWQYSSDGGSNWIDIGAVSDTSALALASTDRIRFLPTANFNGTPGGLALRLWDRTSGTPNTLVDATAVGGLTAFSTQVIALDQAVTAVNDSPVPTATTVALANIDEDTANPSGDTVTALFGPVYTDVDLPSPPVGIAITGNAATLAQGRWQYSTDGGASWIDVPAVSQSAALLLQGSDRLRFVPTANYNGTPGALTTKLWDGTAGIPQGFANLSVGGSSGGATPFSASNVTLTTGIDPVNDAPVASSGSVTLPAILEDTSAPSGDTVSHLFGSIYSDVDLPSPPVGVAITGNAALPGQGVWQYSTDGGSSWTDLPPVSSASALLLQGSDRVRFLPVANYNGTPGALTTRLWDGTTGAPQATADLTAPGATGGITAFGAADVAVQTAVTAVNDSPVAAAGSVALPAILEDTSNPSGDTVTNLFGALYSDVDLGSPPVGIAITGDASTPAQGRWQYSINGGTSWQNLPAVSVGSALLLQASDKLRFLPTPDYNGTPGGLTTRLWDGTTGTLHSTADLSAPGATGGITAFSGTTVSLDTSVTAVNDAPVASSGAVTLPAILEDTSNPSGDTVSHLFGSIYSDVDLPSPPVGVAITGNAALPGQGVWQYSTDGGSSWTDLPPVSSASALLLQGSDRVRFLPVANYNGTPGALTTRLWDGTTGAPQGTADLTAPGATGGITAFGATDVAVQTAITAVNDSPVAAAGSVTLPAILEDTSNPSGDTVANLFGPIYSDVDLVTPPVGIAIIGDASTSAQGRWQYSINGGTSWQNLPAVSVGSALLLQGTDRLRFLPTHDYNGTPGSLTTRLWDGTTGTLHGTADLSAPGATGGITAFGGTDVSLDTSVTAVNDAPVASAGSVTLPAILEDTSNPSGDTVSHLFGSIYSDVDLPSPPVGVAITGNAALPAQGLWQYSTDGGSSWTDLPPVSSASALLLQGSDRVRFLPVANYNGTPGALTTRLWDGTTGVPQGTADLTGPGATGGITAFGATDVAVQTAVTAVNDSPVAAAGSVALPAILEDTTNPSGATVTSLFGPIYSDVDLGSPPVGIAITGDASTLSQGRWQYSINGGTSWQDLPVVSAASALLLQGTDRLRFLPNHDYNGAPGSLTTRLWDGTTGTLHGTADLSAPGATGGITAFSGTTVSLDTSVTAVNDAPVASAGSVTLPAILEDTSNPSGDTVSHLFGSIYSDVDLPSPPVGIAITGNAALPAQGVWQYSVNGGTSWTDLPPVSSASALLLQGSDLVRFLPVANYNGTPGALTTRLWDGTTGVPQGTADLTAPGATGGITAFGATDVAVQTAITAVNDSPVAATGSVTLPAILEDTTNPSGATVTSLFGPIYSDVDLGTPPVGIAITADASTPAQGHWQYSTDGGTNWQDLPAVSASSALLLQGTDRLRFLPTHDYNGAPGSLTTRLWDGTTGTLHGTADLSAPGATGGITAFGGTTVSLDTSVTPVNDAPVALVTSVVLPSVPVGRPSPSGVTVDTLFAPAYSDVDLPSPPVGVAITNNAASTDQGKWQYSQDGGSTWNDVAAVSQSSALLLASTDQLRFLPTSHFAGVPGGLTVRLWDGTTGSSGGRADLSAAGSVGGTTAFSTDPVAVETTVTNSAPTVVMPSGTPPLTIRAPETNPTGETVQTLFALYASDSETAFSNGGVAVIGDASQAQNGVWQYSRDGGANWTALGPVSDSAALVLYASDRLRFAPSGRYSGPSGDLTVRLWDGVSPPTTATVDLTQPGAVGGSAPYSQQSVAIHYDVLNDPPVVTATVATLPSIPVTTTDPSGRTVASLFVGNYADSDTNLVFGGVAITGNASVASEGVWQYSTNGGTTWTSVGSPSASAALLLSGTDRLRFVPATLRAGAPGALTVVLWDGINATAHTTVDTRPPPSGSFPSSPFSIDSVTLKTIVVNNAPVAGATTVDLSTVSFTDLTPAGMVVGNLFGPLYSDLETKIATGGVAVTDNRANPAEGAWQYSTDGGANWQALPSVSANQAFILSASDQLRFTPNGMFYGRPGGLTARLWDGVNASAHSVVDLSSPASVGGSTAFSADAVDVGITVRNYPPVASTATVTLPSIPQGTVQPIATTVANLYSRIYSDVETSTLGGVAVVGNLASAASGRWEYSKDSGASWTAVTATSEAQALMLRPTDQLRFVPDRQFVGKPGALSVRLWDGLNPLAANARLDVRALANVSETVVQTTVTVDPPPFSRLRSEAPVAEIFEPTFDNPQDLTGSSPPSTGRFVTLETTGFEGGQGGTFVSSVVNETVARPVDLAPGGTPNIVRPAAVTVRAANAAGRGAPTIESTISALPGLVSKASPAERVEGSPNLSLAANRVPGALPDRTPGQQSSGGLSFMQQLRVEQDRRAQDSAALDRLLSALSNRGG